MHTRLDAIDRAKELALQGLTSGEIHRELVKDGLGELLHKTEIQRIISETDFVRYLQPKPTGNHFVRIVGGVAVILGLCAILLGLTTQGMRRGGPVKLGAIALVLGSVLMLKPSASKTEL